MRPLREISEPSAISKVPNRRQCEILGKTDPVITKLKIGV